MDMATALAELINKGPMFQACFTDPWVLACIAHVLGDFKLSSLNSRAALPGSHHSDRPRRANSYFTRRANGQQLAQETYIRPETLARLSPAARFILDV